MSNLLYSKILRNFDNNPNKTAIVNGKIRINYQELMERSFALGAQLAPFAQPNNLIAIYMHKGWEQIVAVLGVLFSGAAYLPLDIKLPEEKIKQILLIGNVNIVITQQCYKETLRKFFSIENIYCINQEYHYIVEKFSFSSHPEDIAYVIFTSGSTGEPKGVAIQHFAAMNTIEDINSRFNVDSEDSILALSELNFDLSVYDIFGVLSAGGKIVIPDYKVNYKNMGYYSWLELLEKESITLWNSVPAFFQILIEITNEDLPSLLRLVLLSGDWIPIETIRKGLKKVALNTRLISLGGATEASIWSILYEISEINPNWKSIPYGKSISGQTVEILNENLMQCEKGVIGEIHIGGLGLAKEYYKNKQKTQASFIFDKNANRRLYKTGDMGKYMPDENIEFLGRVDYQVKINGYRIEMGAIEIELLKLTYVERAIVVSKKEALYAYIVLKKIFLNNNQNIEQYINFILEHLSQLFPNYMIPKKILLIDKMPLTQNGKVDRNYLIDNIYNNINNQLLLKLPQSNNEKDLILIWKELFQYSHIGIEDNFFTLGGGSLLATQLITKINEKWDIKLPMSTIFECPTVVKLAKKINKFMLAEEQFPIIKMSNGKENPIFLIHPISGQIFCYTEFVKLFDNERTIYAIELPRAFNNSALSIENLAKTYINYIKLYANPPYILAGWSMGGLIAFEMAYQLGAEQVSFLGLIDSFPSIETFFQTEKVINKKLNNFSFTILDYFCKEVSKVTQIIIDFDLEKFAKLNPVYAIEKISSYIKITCQKKLVGHLEFFEQFVAAFKNMLIGLLNYKNDNKYVKQIYFFRSQEMPSPLLTEWDKLSELKLEIFDIPSSHLDILTNPSVNMIVEKLRVLLGKII